jgi:membrane protein YdbS with pleckstrin-like domain
VAFPRRLLVPGEELVLDLRPHLIALALPALAAAAILIAGAWAMSKVDGFWVWVFLVLMALLLIAYPIRRLVWWLTSHFVVTSDRVVHREGWIAKRSMEIPLEAINDVRFRQSVFERVIGAGTLIIQSASESGREEFKAIRHPEDVQKTIYHEGEKNQQRAFRPADAAGPAPPAPPSPPAPPPSPVAPPGTAPSVVTELERLADLRAKGVLTEEEFQRQKSRILGRS